jgi:hypothetical protein
MHDVQKRELIVLLAHYKERSVQQVDELGEEKEPTSTDHLLARQTLVFGSE